MNPMNMMQMLQQFKANPMQMLARRGINLPPGMNDPNDILNHLLQTGRVSQTQVNQAYQTAQMFRR